MSEMEQIFLPVWGYSRHIAMLRDVGVDNWWGEPPLCYPHGLISYVHWKKAYEFPEGAYIFGDSGGFTLRSPSIALTGKGKALDPVALLDWQISLCTTGAILDLPPRNFITGRGSRLWDKALTITKRHVERALPTYLERCREGTCKFRWWGVAHGNTEDELVAWYRAVADVYPFADEGEGWAVRAEPNVNIYTVARTLRTLQRLKVKRAHLLAATAQEVTALLFVLGPEAGLDLVTYDSAYAIKDGFNRQGFRPASDGLSWSTMREIGDEDTVRRYVIDECECAACVWMRRRSEEFERGREGIRAKVFGGWMSTWLQMHNLNIQRLTLENQAREASHDLLRELLGHKNYYKVLRVFAYGDTEIVPTGTDRSLLDLL